MKAVATHLYPDGQILSIQTNRHGSRRKPFKQRRHNNISNVAGFMQFWGATPVDGSDQHTVPVQLLNYLSSKVCDQLTHFFTFTFAFLY